METIAAKVRFHTFAAIGSLCSIGQIGLRPDLSCATHQGPLRAVSDAAWNANVDSFQSQIRAVQSWLGRIRKQDSEQFF